MNLPANGGTGGSEPEWLEAEKLFHDTVAKHDIAYAGFSFWQGDENAFIATGKNKSMISVFADAYALLQCQGEIKRARETFTSVNGKTAASMNGDRD
ncbi:MAG: hypothetical protein MMC23_003698 [Stictis urceolatum]|nr:hypothetical protein [Stictis urceolata]